MGCAGPLSACPPLACSVHSSARPGQCWSLAARSAGLSPDLPSSLALCRRGAAGKRAALYVKCLVVGGSLLVHWVTAGRPSQPQSASLNTDRYTTDALGAADSYQHMDELVRQLHNLFKPAAAPSGEQPAAADALAAAARQPGQEGGRRQEGEEGRPEPLREGPRGACLTQYHSWHFVRQLPNAHAVQSVAR